MPYSVSYHYYLTSDEMTMKEFERYLSRLRSGFGNNCRTYYKVTPLQGYYTTYEEFTFLIDFDEPKGDGDVRYMCRQVFPKNRYINCNFWHP